MAKQEVWTIGKILKWTEEYFKKAGLDSPRLDAEVLLSHIMKKARIYLYVHFDEPMMAPELAAYKDCIKKRAARMPVAYITGHREFMGIDLKVTQDTLIPRPDTEILVEAAIERLRKLRSAREAQLADARKSAAVSNVAEGPYADSKKADAMGRNAVAVGQLADAKEYAGANVPVEENMVAEADTIAYAGKESKIDKAEAGLLDEADKGDAESKKAEPQPIIQHIADIGTGSGAICLSLLNYIKNLQAVTVDISAGAIAVAKENAEALGFSERIEFLQGDMLQPLRGRVFDAIVSNPPYIPRADIRTLERDVQGYEPLNALDGGQDGLYFYRKLVRGAGALLADDGFLAMEIGINQAPALKKLASESGGWGNVEVIKDLAGIERVVVLWKQK